MSSGTSEPARWNRMVVACHRHWSVYVERAATSISFIISVGSRRMGTLGALPTIGLVVLYVLAAAARWNV